jgi:hypothetical protein
MPVTIDEVSAEVVPGREESREALGGNDRYARSPEAEIRRHRDIHDRLTIRAARLAVE